MPISSAYIMKIIDKRNMRKKQKGTREEEGGDRMETKWFCCAFKLDFLQLICKGSSIFKSNLELALSIVLKGRELYQSKHVALECRCLKIWDLLSFFICFLILV